MSNRDACDVCYWKLLRMMRGSRAMVDNQGRTVGVIPTLELHEFTKWLRRERCNPGVGECGK